MLNGLVPDLAPRLMIAIGGVALAFLVLIAVLLFLRRRNSPLFIKGGRVREHRLLVMDAAAVDAKRRLVLVRRDDVEHLIMIGGPTDIVIETGIGGVVRQKTVAPAPTPERAVIAQRPVVAEKPAAGPVVAPVASGQVLAARPAQAAAVAAVPNAAQAEAMRRRQGQNGDAAQNARRLERQAARAAEAARNNAPKVAAVSAMGSMLYDDDREPLTGTVAPAQTGEEGAAKPVNADQRPVQRTDPIAAQAENILDQARDRVLNAPAEQAKSQPKPSGNEDAIRQLEEQLEAGKAESLRAEAARAEAAKTEAARVEAARLEAERVAAVRADAERAEAVRAEAARLEAVRIEARRAEAAKLESERALRMRAEAERAEAERAEAVRAEEEKAEAARTEAARLENERIAAARAEAMARFEAARRAQAEQRQAQLQPASQQAAVEQPVVQQPQAQQPLAQQNVVQQPVAQQYSPPVVEPPVVEPAVAEREPETAALDDDGIKSQERLATDFEKLLEAELEADGILDNYPAPVVTGERREQGLGTPAVNPVQRDTQPITGAVPGVSIEHDMARRLGEISLNKKNDAL